MECFNCGNLFTSSNEYAKCNICDSKYNNISHTLNTEYKTVVKLTQIEKDFEKYVIPREIKACAANFYNEITNGDILKDNNRRGIMWMCCYEAYKHHGVAVDPTLLSKKFKIGKKQMNKALRSFWERVHKQNLIKKFPKIQLSVVDLIPVFGDLLDLDQNTENDMIELSEQLDLASTSISKCKPRTVAASIVYWHISTNIDIDINVDNVKNTKKDEKEQIAKFCNKFDIKKTTLEKIIGIIKQIRDN